MHEEKWKNNIFNLLSMLKQTHIQQARKEQWLNAIKYYKKKTNRDIEIPNAIK